MHNILLEDEDILLSDKFGAKGEDEALQADAAAAGQAAQRQSIEARNHPAPAAGFKFDIDVVGPPDALVFEYGCRLDKSCLEAFRDQCARARRLYNEIAEQINLITDDAKSRS